MSTSINMALQNNTPFNQQVSLFNNGSIPAINAAGTDFNFYQWNVTSFSFLYESAITIQNKLIGASSFNTSFAFIATQTFQGICDALNSLNIGQFYTTTVGANTFIQVYSNVYTFGSLDVTQGLSLTFDNISNAPVADPYNVADWNAFFATYTLPFTYVSVVGNTVNLFGATFLTIDNNKFKNSTSILNVVNYGAAISANTSSFENSSITSFIDDTPGAVALIGVNSFKNCTSLLEFSTNSFISISGNSFENCTGINSFYLPNMSVFGTNVFLGIIGRNITLTIPAALVSDANVLYLQANNTVTLITT